ncbi:hypothetical protein P7B02_12660 [Caulobacter segnis]|uniref:hypothetical protein n=1 Tax=Caulobacter segnis TaxID=88688 RepID=UPI00240EEAC0|nr:hypothetical protein [Caulobacter segnis]MDG2522397.1 hypothetical protein [Caulobacter segnis]
MEQAVEDELRAKIEANDRLLKALMTLLALRDPDLLDELRAVFTIAAVEGSKVGDASPEVWAHIRKELAIVADLARDAPDDLH